MVFFWTGRGNAVDEPLRDPETLKGGMGGVHTLDGLDAGDKNGPRNMVVAELTLGRLAPAPSVMAAAADVRQTVELETEPVEVRYGELEATNGGRGRGNSESDMAVLRGSWLAGRALRRGVRVDDVAVERDTIWMSDETLLRRDIRPGMGSGLPG